MNGKQHKAVGIAFGAIATYVVLEKFNAGGSAIVIPFTSALGAMLPDIDHDRTKLGRKRNAFFTMSAKIINTILIVGFILCAVIGVLTMKQIIDFGINLGGLVLVMALVIAFFVVRKIITSSKTFKWAVKHRGLMHTLLMPVIIGLGMYFCPPPILRCCLFGLEVGYLSHLLVDMENVGGVPLLFPLTTINIRILRIPTEKEGMCNVACFITCLLFGATAYWYYFV